MTDFKFKTKPLPHQEIEFIDHWEEPGRALFWEMGVGKTKPVIDSAAYLYRRGRVGGMLVVAPKGVEQNWHWDELPKHMPDAVRWRSFLWSTERRGTKKFKAELKEFLKFSGCQVLCMSYDAMMTDDAAATAKAFLQQRPRIYVADETTRIKTPGAKVTKRMLASAKYAPYRRIFNGTPASDNPFHVYSQLKFVDPDVWKRELDIPNFLGFKGYFGSWVELQRRDTGQKFSKLVKYRNLDRLNEIVDKYGTRLLKTDVVNLPPKVYSKVYFELSPKQRKVYKQLEDEFRAELSGDLTITADIVIARMVRLQQVCAGHVPSDQEGNLLSLCSPNPRIQALLGAVEDVRKKAIIWCKYDVEVDEVAAALTNMGRSLVTFDGRTSAADRQQAKVDFQEGCADFFIGKPSACGRGITLTAADTVIYYSNSFVLDERLQSEDRAHRVGQDKTVMYIDIVAKGTIDEYIINKLRSKREVSAIVMGDDLPEWI